MYHNTDLLRKCSTTLPIDVPKFEDRIAFKGNLASLNEKEQYTIMLSK